MAKPLVEEAITTTGYLCQGASMLFYPAALSLSAETLTYVAGVIRRHRKKIGSCWRKLNPGRQALLVLGLPAQRRNLRRAGRRVRHRHSNSLAVRQRDRGPAGRPRPEAAPGTGRRPAGRTRLRRHRRHLNPDPPCRRRRAVLLRQAPPPRDQPEGHLPPHRGDPLAVRPPARSPAHPPAPPV